MALIYVDIDGIICRSENITDDELDYNHSTPIIENIEKINSLFALNTVVLWTARGKRTGKYDWRDLTVQQMEKWGVKYHQISFVKPHYDILIDDKSINNLKDLVGLCLKESD